MKACSSCGMRIVPIGNGIGSLRCKYDLRAVEAEHSCPSWEATYISPNKGIPKRGTKRGTKITKNERR